MAKKQKKQEALSVSRLINEVLVAQLSIPFRQIVNDTTFSKYTGSKRPDILISEFEYDGTNDEQYIKNLVAYAEAKDDCKVEDKDWKDALKQGKIKAPKLGLPYFIVTNCKTTYFYNAKTLKQLTLNGNPIREFQTIDIYRLIKNKLTANPDLDSINTNVDSISTISEAIFNKKLWELAGVYRGINFKDNVQKIDFTVGFVALEYFEEKEEIDGTKDSSKVYWSTCNDDVAEKVKNNLSGYISRLEDETTFKEFKNVMEVVRIAISGDGKNKPLIGVDDVKQIYSIIDSMKPLHGTGFDLFGAVYEMFASSKEKKDFGEYFTRRHYTHIFSKLLLQDEDIYNEKKEFSIIDPACGTGGFLTESFKVLLNNYEKSGTLTTEAREFLSKRCFYGVDVRDENISRTRLNMFLVGDFYQHTYDTSRDGNVNKNLYSNYDNYVNKFKLSIPQLEFDKTSFSKSKRCSKEVCSFINEQLDIDIESYFNHTSIVKEITDEDEIKNIITNPTIVKLFYQNSKKYDIRNVDNWGNSKGETYDDVCVILNETTYQLYKNKTLNKLAPSTKNKLYVACSRPLQNLYIVYEKSIKAYLK